MTYEKRTVAVIRIMYGGKDIEKELNDMARQSG
jgi:hypothetical protein